MNAVAEFHDAAGVLACCGPSHLFIPAAEYHAVEAMSASGAKRMLQSPAHYKLFRDKPSEPTAAMQFGTLLHALVLEPDKASYAVAPDVDRRTTAGKAAWSSFQAEVNGRDIVVVTEADMARVRRCVAAVRAHPAARRLLDNASAIEGSLFWRDGRFDVPCKARYDLRAFGGFADLKSCQDASPDGFARQVANYDYHVQAAHYMSGAEHVLDETPAFFAFIAVESEPPHAVGVYALPGNAIQAGAHRMNIALERYRDALAAGRFPGYPDTIETLQLPKWALRFDA